jgi:hypothetical protein
MRTIRFVAVWTLFIVYGHIPAANAQAANPLQTGYIKVIPDSGTTSPSGVAIFGFRPAGVLTTEAGVPATSASQSGRIFAEVGGVINTGIALANPNVQDAIISYYFTDGSGTNFGTGTFTLPGNHQIAAFLNETPFNLTSSLVGTFSFSSSVPVGAIALRTFVNERSELVITTLPVSPLGPESGRAALLIPHFTDGGGWTTQVVLINPGATALSGTIHFLNQGSKTGSAQSVNVVVNGLRNSAFSYVVPPNSAFRIGTQMSQTGIQVGSVEIIPAKNNTAPSSLAIFSYQNAGVTVSAASVLALPPAIASRMYIESSGTFGQIGSIQTGLTISNPTTNVVSVNLSLTALDGTATGLSTTVTLASRGQIAKFANELFPQLPSSFRGVLRITSAYALAVTSLRGRYNERGDLLVTTTPPWDESSAPVPQSIFPHFASGGGYSTQLVLLSAGPPQTGKLSLLSQDGGQLPGNVVQSNP